jgi:hypothetical protein
VAEGKLQKVRSSKRKENAGFAGIFNAFTRNSNNKMKSTINNASVNDAYQTKSTS